MKVSRKTIQILVNRENVDGHVWGKVGLDLYILKYRAMYIFRVCMTVQYEFKKLKKYSESITCLPTPVRGE